MALIAINAVVHIPADVRVMEIGCVPAPVATRALKDRIVAGIRVAGAANRVRIAVIHVEERVILRGQVRWHPSRGGMTCVAGRRPRRGLVIGVSGVVVVCDVATGTDGGQRGVVVVHVATRAGNARMSSRKRKGRVVVVKRALAPGGGVMAHLAGGRKTQLNVINRR